VVSGGGLLENGTVTSVEHNSRFGGTAGTTWTLGSPGAQTVEVSVKNLINTVTNTFFATATALSHFADDFSMNLGNWIEHDPDNLGSWVVQNGELIGDYNIGCGGTTCNQTQLLLAPHLQPGNVDWRMEVQSGLIEAYCCFNGGEMTNRAKFALWVSDSEKEIIDVGGWWIGIPVPASWDSSYVYHQAYPWHQKIGFLNAPVPTWFPNQWQTAALEKRGNTYTVFFNGLPLYSVTRTFSSAPQVGLQTYGKVRMDNFKLFILP
jgi:hypothetical protein